MCMLACFCVPFRPSYFAQNEKLFLLRWQTRKIENTDRVTLVFCLVILPLEESAYETA